MYSFSVRILDPVENQPAPEISVPSASEGADASDESFALLAQCWLQDHCERRVADGMQDAEIDTGGAEAVRSGRKFQADLHDAGLAGISWPAEYGGQGRSLRDEHAFAVASAPYVLPNRVLSIGLGMCGPTILARGREFQRQRYLRPLLRGEEAWSQLFSEPGAGSDLGSVSTRAVDDGDSWVVTGQKVWSSGAHYADFGMLLARTAPKDAGRDGFTMFILDMRAPGVEVRPLREMTGESRFNEVFLEEVRIPKDAAIGPVGAGWSVAMTTLTSERYTIAGTGFAARAGQVSHLMTLAAERGMSQDAIVRQRVADLWIKERLLAMMMGRASDSVLAGKRAGPEGSLAKLMTSRLMRELASFGAEMAGPSSVAWDENAPGAGLLAKRVEIVVGLSIAGGTDEILLNTVGERVLGLPREPRVSTSQSTTTE
jgi:alkylation response protein AidB-like acyl-CoA dehydrogenase